MRVIQTKIGLWFDHQRAVIVLPTLSGAEVKVILAPGVPMAQDTPLADGDGDASNAFHDFRMESHLTPYFGEVIASIHHARSLLVFGPGRPKEVLVERLVQEKPFGRVVRMESAGALSTRQITARVQGYFRRGIATSA